ncbi:MAG: hypothetical protein IBJ18_12235 [Phycisphaerales bacterium]|nr:hypothetical protein [Phycisphaerales bacterium]
MMLNDSVAVYKFRNSSAGGEWGELEICRKTGRIQLLKPAEHKHEFAYARAARKISVLWKEGSLPEETEWAT